MLQSPVMRADGAHSGAQQWEGITGRVKHLVKQDNDRLMSVIERSHAAMNTRIDASQQAIKGVQDMLEAQHQMLSALLDQKK